MSQRRPLLLLGCGFEQIAALRAARVLGLPTVAFDGRADAEGREIADVFAQVDLKDHAALLEAARRVDPGGVFVHAAELAVEAAIVAEALGLPGTPVPAAIAATDKAVRIETFERHGIETPGFEILDPARELEHWLAGADRLGWPCVVKPDNQAGARGVQLVEDEAQLAAYYAARAIYGAKHFVCETLVTGVELSTETVFCDGEPRHTAIALRHYDTSGGYRPWFIEDGHSYPYALAPGDRAQVERTIRACHAALATGDGVLKGDLVLTPDGRVVVLEMAARTSGGRFADTVVPLATGVDILPPLIEQAMGLPFSRDWFAADRALGVSQRFFLHAGPGRITRWPDPDAVLSGPEIHATWIDRGIRDTNVLPPVRSHRDRLGYVICTGATREAADRLARDRVAAFMDALGIETDEEATT